MSYLDTDQVAEGEQQADRQAVQLQELQRLRTALTAAEAHLAGAQAAEQEWRRRAAAVPGLTEERAALGNEVAELRAERQALQGQAARLEEVSAEAETLREQVGSSGVACSAHAPFCMPACAARAGCWPALHRT